MHGGITVTELAIFERFADESLDEQTRVELAEFLAYRPTAGDLIPNSGGLRKLRWKLPGKGKRGGARVIYYYYDSTIPVYLITGYTKGVKDDLGADELKTFRDLASAIKARARARTKPRERR